MTTQMRNSIAKLLNCMFNNNLALSKWNRTFSPLCDNCIVEKGLKHLLLERIIIRISGKKQKKYYVLELRANI